VLHTIEYKLRQGEDHRLWGSIREILSTHQRLSLKNGEVRLELTVLFFIVRN
jgi:hypothetical protein